MTALRGSQAAAALVGNEAGTERSVLRSLPAPHPGSSRELCPETCHFPRSTS